MPIPYKIPIILEQEGELQGLVLNSDNLLYKKEDIINKENEDPDFSTLDMLNIFNQKSNEEDKEDKFIKSAMKPVLKKFREYGISAEFIPYVIADIAFQTGWTSTYKSFENAVESRIDQLYELDVFNSTPSKYLDTLKDKFQLEYSDNEKKIHNLFVKKTKKILKQWRT